MTINYENLIDTCWPIPNVLAFSTTRHKPCLMEDEYLTKTHPSNISNAFDYFNLGTHVTDRPANVQKNRKLLQSLLPQKTKVQWLNQTHGNDVVKLSTVNSEPLTADASITCSRNIALAIMTADCLPILLSNTQGTEIAAIHGGWRSLATNIVSNTIRRMSTKPEHIIAWFGPCIGPSVFEVGEEVRRTFMEISLNFENAFSAVENHLEQKYLANLQSIAKIQLNSIGVMNIIMNKECTFSDKDKYYSYRRDGITGRMVSIITLI